MQKRPRRPQRARCSGQKGGPRPNRRPRGRLRDSCWNSLASSENTTAQQIELATEAVTKGCVEKSGDEGERRCDDSEPPKTDGVPEHADHGEPQPDRLREPGWLLWLELGRFPEPSRKRVPEQHTVRSPA